VRNAAILVERIARAGWFNWVPSRHLRTGMAIIVFVLEFDGPSLAQGIDLSTPEKTIEAYYSALNRADVPAFMATLLNPGDPSGMSFGVPRTYRIIEVKKILRSDRDQPGDVEVLVHADVKWPDQLVRLETYFQLRWVNDQWKIVEWAVDSEGPD